MKVIMTFTFCCDNLRKSKFMALKKPGKLREFFLLLCGHPVYRLGCVAARGNGRQGGGIVQHINVFRGVSKKQFSKLS